METKKKEIIVQTHRGTLVGIVEIRLNIKTTTVKFTHSITHDDVEKQVGIHKVVAIIDEKEIPALASVEFMGKDNVLFHANAVEKALRNYLQTQGDSKYESLDDRLKQNGYV